MCVSGVCARWRDVFIKCMSKLEIMYGVFVCVCVVVCICGGCCC